MSDVTFRSFQDVPRPRKPMVARAWAAIKAVPQPTMRIVELWTGGAIFFAIGVAIAERI